MNVYEKNYVISCIQLECCKILQKCTVITKFIKLSYFNHVYYCIKCPVIYYYTKCAVMYYIILSVQ